MASTTLHTGSAAAPSVSAVSLRAHRARRALHTPAAVLLASSVLAGAFLVAVSDLASRLG